MAERVEMALNLANRAESLPVKSCKFCGGEIAWVKSKKTGKYYPAQVIRTPSESATRMWNLRVAPWQPHKCGETHDDRRAREEREQQDRLASIRKGAKMMREGNERLRERGSEADLSMVEMNEEIIEAWEQEAREMGETL